ncbi:N-acetylmuramoyl-L-alanine amidase [Halobacteroides halobius DSM 5150]|uniref:N-acetylmuramoyl-L-alanine amidase n=1 Tax=Halobacteroides halobius (strain ATCC 35273 / DSM 5150 / MD-1) TaxID=748449 RepID=L0K809_HALHC|nr:N-acetylmuramoyl-L-alanine amidase [Halobacteroides halobius]AGB40685.1 N-acetylmuramoyl-L-alanine amidase [Halobacteroides halobius DSM 5150]
MKRRLYFISIPIIMLILISIFLLSSGITWVIKSKPTTSQLKRTIIIDAGHGGVDPGTHKNGVLEKNINLAIAKKLANFLSRGNFNLIMTRTEDRLYQDDRNKDIRHRVKVANQNKADLLVSIHVNSFPSSSSFGGQTFYASDDKQGKKLAAAIQKQLIAIQPQNHRQIKSASYYLLKKTKIPAVIIEVGFISNSQDRNRITNPKKQEKIARAIGKGVINYLNNQLEN